MKRRDLIFAAGALALGLGLSACSTTPSTDTTDTASARQEIDSGVDAAFVRLYANTDGTKEAVAKAKAVLVIPRVVSAGVVVGGSYGRGALRIGNRTDGYYRATGASLGLIAGAQSTDIFLLFMTDAALEKFRTSSGWTAGIDASVALSKIGTGDRVDSESARHDVLGFVLSNGGLMANLSIEGTKLSRLDL
jgi:lipid-binding SYLF domain-containing protein